MSIHARQGRHHPLAHHTNQHTFFPPISSELSFSQGSPRHFSALGIFMEHARSRPSLPLFSTHISVFYITQTPFSLAHCFPIPFGSFSSFEEILGSHRISLPLSLAFWYNTMKDESGGARDCGVRRGGCWREAVSRLAAASSVQPTSLAVWSGPFQRCSPCVESPEIPCPPPPTLPCPSPFSPGCSPPWSGNCRHHRHRTCCWSSWHLTPSSNCDQTSLTTSSYCE